MKQQDPSVIGMYARGCWDELNLQQKAVAAAMNMDPSTFSKKLNGVQEFTPTEIFQLGRATERARLKRIAKSA